MEYDKWIQAVDRRMYNEHGIDTDDLSCVDYTDMYMEGLCPQEVLDELEEAIEDFLNERESEHEID